MENHMAQNPILKKLRLTDQSPVLIVNAPDAYRPVMADIDGDVHESPEGEYAFVHVFAEKAAALDKFGPAAVESVTPEGYLWISYPKKSSKHYKSDISRDSDWAVLGERGFEPVTQVSIDEDWSALRFRPVGEIKSMTRKGAISEEGKKRIEGNE
jgi:hypothetical protein